MESDLNFDTGMNIKKYFINLSHKIGKGKELGLNFSFSFPIFFVKQSSVFVIRKNSPIYALVKLKSFNIYLNLKNIKALDIFGDDSDKGLIDLVSFCVKNKKNGYISEKPLFSLLNSRFITI